MFAVKSFNAATMLKLVVDWRGVPSGCSCGRFGKSAEGGVILGVCWGREGAWLCGARGRGTVAFEDKEGALACHWTPCSLLFFGEFAGKGGPAELWTGRPWCAAWSPLLMAELPCGCMFVRQCVCMRVCPVCVCMQVCAHLCTSWCKIACVSVPMRPR